MGRVMTCPFILIFRLVSKFFLTFFRVFNSMDCILIMGAFCFRNPIEIIKHLGIEKLFQSASLV